MAIALSRFRIVGGTNNYSPTGRPATTAVVGWAGSIYHTEEEVPMTSVKMIAQEDATGKTQEIYQDIMDTLGIDFVPNMYKVMAVDPDFLEVKWNQVKSVMKGPGKLDPLTKEIIAVAVSAVSGCDYWIKVHTSAVRKHGLDDEGVLELMAVVDLFAGLNKLLEGLQVEMDEKPWYGWG
jgi:AhpD family alkylhydroperoxidase